MADQGKDERTWISVHDGMPDHPKIEALSDKAFRALVELWCWCSRNKTDGVIKAPVWQKRAPAKARAELFRELVHAPGHTCPQCPDVPAGHVLMHDYLRHQSSAAEIDVKKEAKRNAGMLGNHNRWHVGKKWDPDCDICVANGSQVRSQPGSQNGSRSDRKSSPPTQSPNEETLGGGVPEANAHASRPPERCPKHLTAPTSEPCGKCGDARRASAAWDDQDAGRRQAILRDVEAAIADPRQRCEHGTDGGRFTHPATGKSATCALCRLAPVQEAS